MRAGEVSGGAGVGHRGSRTSWSGQRCRGEEEEQGRQGRGRCQNHLGGSLKHSCSRTRRELGLSRSGMGLRICTSDRFLGGGDAAGLGTTC